MTRRRGRLVALVLAVMAALVLLLASRPLRVWYHRTRMVGEYNRATEIGPQGDQHPHILAFEEHRDALVRLGFFQHKRMPLRTVSIPSDRSKTLFHDLNRHLELEDGYFEGHGYEPETPDEVVLWATAEKMQVLERIVRDHEETKAAEHSDGSAAAMPGEDEGREKE
jgi:hypothetical protein